MLKFIRSIVRTLTGKTDRSYTGDGRPDEKIAGKMYQHYGFRSQPPAGIELVHLEQNNIGISVAENDGSIFSADQETGDVAVYSQHSGKSNAITLSSDGIGIFGDTDNTETSIIVDGDNIDLSAKNDIFLRVKTGNFVLMGKISDPPPPGEVAPMSLLTINFYNTGYALHTHGTVAAPLVPITGTPITPPEVPVTPWSTTNTGAN